MQLTLCLTFEGLGYEGIVISSQSPLGSLPLEEAHHRVMRMLKQPWERSTWKGEIRGPANTASANLLAV